MSTLPDLAGRVAEDPDAQELFAERLDQIVEQLRNQQSQFEAYLEENPELEELLAAEIDEISERMDEYEEVLEQLEARLEEDLSSLQEFSQNASVKGHALRLAWDRFLEARSSVIGPTPLGQINYLVQLVEEMLSGELPASFVGTSVRKEEQQIQLALLSADENLSPPLTELKNCLKAFADDLDLNQLNAAVERHLQALIASANQVSESQRISQLQRKAEGPTCLASINLILNGLEAWRRGDTHPEELVGPLQSFYQVVPQLMALAPSVVQNGGQAVLHEEALKLQEIVRSLEEEVLVLEESVFNGQEQDWEELVAEIQALCEELATVKTAVEELAELEGKVPCVSCGHYNPQERSQCEKCAAVLPKAAQERVAQIDVVAQQDGISDTAQETGGLKMTENFKRLFSTIDEYLEGKVAARQLIRELQRTEVLAKRVEEVKLDVAEVKAGAELKKLHRHSIKLFGEALQFLIEGCREEDLSKVEQGRSALWDGAAALQELQSRLATVPDPG